MEHPQSNGFTNLETFLLFAFMAIAVVETSCCIALRQHLNQQLQDSRNFDELSAALEQYKAFGGDVKALTAGAQFHHVIAALKKPVVWVFKSRQFLSPAFTCVAQSMEAKGTGFGYYFVKVNTCRATYPYATNQDSNSLRR